MIAHQIMELKHLLKAFFAPALLFISLGLQAQTTRIAIQDFEATPATPTWGYTNTGGAFATTSSGSGFVPNSNFYLSGVRGFQVNNGTSTLVFDNVATGSFTNINLTLRLASFSFGATNGADIGDYVRIEVSTNGGTTWSNELEVSGNNNARWDYSGGTSASTPYDGNNVPTTQSPPAGGTLTTTGISTMRITGLPSVANLRIRITMLNNAANEVWVIDDVELRGDPIACSTPSTLASGLGASGITASSANLAWTSGNGTNRLVSIRPAASAAVAPSNGNDYLGSLAYGSGANLGSNNFVLANTSGNSLSVSNLLPGTTYIYTVYEFNCSGASALYAAGTSFTFTTPPANVGSFDFVCPGTSMDFSWTLPAGDYDGIVIFARPATTPADPIADASTYVGANADYSLAPDYGARGRLVYKGNGTNFTLTGLTPYTDYVLKAFTYKNNVATVWSSGTQRSFNSSVPEVTIPAAVGSSSSSVQVSWANPSNAACYDEILVVASNAPVTFVPTGNGSAYTANSAYSSPNQVVYQGNGTSVNVTGLTTGTTYYFEIFVRKGNEWSPGVGVTATPSVILYPGDMIIVGFSNYNSGPEDIISIVTLVDLPRGTQFMLSNASYELYAPANVRTDRWYSCTANGDKNIGSQLFTYNGATTLPRGSIICITLPSTGLATNVEINGVSSTSDFIITGAGTPNTGVNMSTSAPDAIFLMQGNWVEQVDHYTFNGRVLGGIQDGALWYQFSDDLTALPATNARRRSRVHPDIECTHIQANTTTGNYARRYNGTRTGTRENLIGAIVNYSTNWISVSPSSANLGCGSTFTVSGTGNPAGVWTGAVDNNWFNCRNWLNLQVPDEQVNVTLNSTYATQNAVIDPAAPFAMRYQQLAKTKDLDLAHQDLQLTNGATLETHGNFILRNTGRLRHEAGTNYILYGDWDNQRDRNAYLEGGRIQFVGTTDQIIATNDPGGVETFTNFVINKPSGGLYNFANELQISQFAQFLNGILYTTATEYILFEAAATWTGGSDASHVNGPVLKETNLGSPTNFTFPIGKNGHLGLAAFETQNGLGEYFSGEYFHNGFGTYTKDPNCLDHVSRLEYWDIAPVLGLGEAIRLTLHWTPYSDVLNVADLRIAHYFGSPLIWYCEPHINTTGNIANGTITSDWISSFSPFTLGSPTSDASLPLDLLRFEAEKRQQTAVLSWEVAQEKAHSVYHLQRSSNGLSFETIGQVAAQQRSQGASYVFVDEQPTQGYNYYRLLEVEADGSTDLSPVRALYFEATSPSWQLYPNPAKDQAQLQWSTGLEQDTKIELSNALGQVVLQNLATQGTTQWNLDLSNLPAGSYWLRWQDQTVKLIKQ
jgi:hypothetical protein